MNRFDLGDLCHFRNGYVPVAVVTDLDGNIIFSNESTDLNSKSRWTVSGVRTMVTRFWAASTAYVVLSTQALDTLPEYPTDKAGIEREVCIWTGYLDFLRPVVPQDLGTRLLRRFVGVIDLVKSVGSAAGGYTITLQMRDRIKWLMDTVVTYNPTQEAGEKELRSNLILEVAQRGIGQVEGDKAGGCAVCGKKILWDEKYLYDLGDTGDQKQSSSVTSVPPANLWYLDGGPLVATTRTANRSVSKYPHFRIYTTRTSINLQQGPNFLVANQVPIDILKFMAMQEVYPTEVFQDNRDGNFYYSPRANDVTGLKDPKRFFRTYYFRDYPNSLPVDGGNAAPPDINQLLHAFSEEQSSLGLKTNFWVHKNAPTAQGAAQDDWTIHLRTRPKVLEGVEYACKFTRIFDDTITTAEEAAVVALNAARIMGKEVRAATAVLLGDPTLVPGEVVQILGSPLQPGRGFPGALNDRARFQQYNDRYNDNLKQYAEASLKNAGASAPAIQGASVSLPVYDGTTATVKVEGKSQENQDTLICQASSSAGAGEDVSTMWRVEALIDKFMVGGKGWTTELALTSPF